MGFEVHVAIQGERDDLQQQLLQKVLYPAAVIAQQQDHALTAINHTPGRHHSETQT
jgi:hypothetical protein